MEKKGGGQDSECSKYEMEESPSEENRKIRRDKAEEAGAEENIEGRTFPMALSLPDDLIGRVFSQLDCVDLLECSVVCKYVSFSSYSFRFKRFRFVILVD